MVLSSQGVADLKSKPEKYNKNNVKDRRVGRTRQLLIQSLESLILEKPYADITVQDIIDRANVGRSTFYTHFLDKDHLLKSTIDKVRDTFAEHYQKATNKGQLIKSGLTLDQAR